MKRGLRRLRDRLGLMVDWVVAQIAFSLLAVLKRLPPHKALNFADWLARTLGPLTPRHKLALDNLRQAYPDKDAAWAERTARANWGQMGRIAAEYVFLDRLFDYVPGRPDGDSGLAAKYAAAIQEAVRRNWRRPDNIPLGQVCRMYITQLPGGEVMSVEFDASCPYDAQGRRSVEAAVRAAEPLPYAGFEPVFNRRLNFNFRAQD